MVRKAIFVNPNDSKVSVKRKFTKLNPNKVVTNVRLFKPFSGLQGVAIARKAIVSYRKKR